MEMAPEEVMVIDIDPAELALILLSFPSGGRSQRSDESAWAHLRIVPRLA